MINPSDKLRAMLQARLWCLPLVGSELIELVRLEGGRRSLVAVRSLPGVPCTMVNPVLGR